LLVILIKKIVFYLYIRTSLTQFALLVCFCI